MKITKTSYFLGLAISSVLIISGCDKTASDITAEPDTSSETTSVAQENKSPMPISAMTAENIKYGVFTPIINSDSITAEQKECLQKVDNSKVAFKADEFYKEKFSKEELDELNEFYASETGQTFSKYGIQQILTSSGLPTEENVVTPTEEQMTEIMTTLQKPTFQKFQQLNMSGESGNLTETINEEINNELKNCKIDMQI